jgi:hypothetical protein
MQPIITFLDSIKVGRIQSHRNMALYPLLAPDAGPPDYITLDEALSRGAVRVTEVDHEGSVTELKLMNNSSEKVLVVDGEELVGARQNRIVNSTFLIPPKGKVIIPVSCVEEGRWSWSSPAFSPGKAVMPMFLRKAHISKVSENLSKGEGFHSDQSMIWEELDGLALKAKARAPSRAMSDIYEETSEGIDGYLRAFRLVECQVGAIFALDGNVVGLEAFGHKSTFASLFHKIIRSYALDALLGHGAARSPSRERARGLLEGLKKAEMEVFPSLGLGQSTRISRRGLSGAALVYDRKVLHLLAFKSAPGAPGGGKSSMERFSSRSRRLGA